MIASAFNAMFWGMLAVGVCVHSNGTSPIVFLASLAAIVNGANFLYEAIENL